MDREKVRRNIKALKTIGKIYIIEFVIFVILSIIVFFIEDKNSFFVHISTVTCLYMVLLAIILAVYGVWYLIPCIIYKIRNKNADINEKGYNYEPPYDYSPAIASYLLNYNVESLVDTRAVRLNLLLNGYLDIDNKDQYIWTSKLIDKLDKHEREVYRNVNKNYSKIEEKFMNYLYEDLEKMNLIKKRKESYQSMKILLIYIICIIIYVLLTSILFKVFENITDGFIIALLITLPQYVTIILGFPVCIFLIKKLM